MKKLIIILGITLLISNKYDNVFGQDAERPNRGLKKHPIDFAVGNFAVGMPFSKLLTNNFYPLATLGTECYYLDKRHSKVYQTVKIGGYYNKFNTSAIFVNTEIGYRYTFGFGLFADATLGIGYSHLFRPNAIYKLDSNREYERVREWGAPSLMANYSLSLGYEFKNQLNKPVSVFLRYGSYVELFYNPMIVALPQNSFQVGTRFLIN